MSETTCTVNLFVISTPAAMGLHRKNYFGEETLLIYEGKYVALALAINSATNGLTCHR